MFCLKKKILFPLKLKLLLRRKSFFFLRRLKKEYPLAQIYLVGGAVRDLFLSTPTQDYDFVVRNLSLKELKNFLSLYGKVNLVGENFGVLKFVPFESSFFSEIDIAFPRRDFSFGTGGYRDVEAQYDSQLPIEEDLSRRDFTINSMAIELNFGIFKKFILIDPYQGEKDLENKIIRSVGQPEKRFAEDYSRLLRAIRFICQLSRYKFNSKWRIEKRTWRAIKENMPHLFTPQRQVVPYEVIAKEFLLAFASHPLKAFDLYDQSGAFEKLMPEILKMKGCPQPRNWHSEGDVWTHTRLALKNLYSPAFFKEFKTREFSLELVLSVIFHDIGKPYTIQTPNQDHTDRIRFNEHDTQGGEIAKNICQRLKLSSPPKIGISVDNVVWLINHHMLFSQGRIEDMKASTIEKYFFNPLRPGLDLLKLSFLDISATVPPSGQPNFSDFYKMLARIDSLRAKKYQQKKEQRLPAPLINGHELIQELNLSPGPQIGKLLKLVREEQLNGRIKNKKDAFDFLKKVYASRHKD